MARRLARAIPSLPLMRHITEARLDTFRREFHEATALITSRRSKIAIPFLYLLTEWITAAVVLYLCFLATGYAMPPGALAAGFAVGVFIFLISVVPG